MVSAKFPTDQYESTLKLTNMVSQSSKQLLVMTPAEHLIRYLFYKGTDSQKKYITSARTSLYSLKMHH